MLALNSMARRLSCTLRKAAVYCASRKTSSLTALPTFDVVTALPQNITPNELPQAERYGHETASPGAPTDLGPDSQCYLASGHTDGAFLTERQPLALLGNGLVGEVWYEQATSAEGTIVPLVTKLYDYQLPTGTLGLYVELFLYASWDHLRSLQGLCVPTVVGSFSAPGGKIALLMEPLSLTGWREASMSDSEETKEKVIAAYAMIHAQGVLHNDVELRHMLISNEGDVQIIDWQMAKSTRPNEAVGLKICTQRDLDYEARKVKVILNYQSAYARELEPVASLYDAYFQGYPADKDDPRLEWFPPDELELMSSGEWTEPSPECTGGRATVPPTLRHHFGIQSSTNNRCRSKRLSGNSHSLGTNAELDSTTTTTTNTAQQMANGTEYAHEVTTSSTSTFTNTNPLTSHLFYEVPDVPRSPPPEVTEEEYMDEEDDIAENDCPFIGGSKRAIKHLRQSFGFVASDPTRRASKEETKPLGLTQAVPDSGLLRPKLGPTRSGFALPPNFNQQAAKHPQPVYPLALPRYTQWRLTSYSKLPKSPLNPTTSRATLPSRKEMTICGSEQFIQLRFSSTSDRALRPCGAIILGSTPEKCFITSGPRPFLAQPKYPPPCVKSGAFKHDLAAVIGEERLAVYLDSEYRLRKWRNDLATLAFRVAETNEDAGPAPPQLLYEWNIHLSAMKCAAKCCKKLVDRRSDIDPTCSKARQEHLEKILPRLAKVQEMIQRRSISAHTEDRVDDNVLESSSPSTAPQDDLIQVNESTSSTTSPCSVHNMGAQSAPDETLSSSDSPQTTSHSAATQTPASLPATLILECSLAEIKEDTSALSSSVASPSPVASSSPTDRKPRRRSAPYPEPSNRRLRSAGRLSEPSSIQESKAQTGTPDRKTSRKSALRAQASPTAAHSNLTESVANDVVESSTTEPHYCLRPRKRPASDDSTEDSTTQLSSQRPSKRPRT